MLKAAKLFTRKAWFYNFLQAMQEKSRAIYCFFRHAALHDTFLIRPSDITEVWLKKTVADKTLKLSSMFAAGDGQLHSENKV